MDPKAILNWKVIKALKEIPDIHHNYIFNTSPNTGLYGQLGIPLRYGYIPQTLSPTITYYQTIKNLLHAKWNIEIADKKFPFEISIPNLDIKVKLNLRARIFPPNIIALTVAISEFPIDLDPNRLIDFQRIDMLEPIADIVRWTLGIADTLDHKNIELNSSFHFYPALNLGDICSPAQFQLHIKDNFNKYVGILIRNYDYKLMDPKIPERMFQKNQEHNLKSKKELLLVDKQGILYLTPSNSANYKTWKENFTKVQNLCEIANVYSTFLRNYVILRSINEDLADFLLYKVQFLINEPEIAFIRSKTYGYIWALLSEEFQLKSTINSVMKPSVTTEINEKSDYFDQFTVGWWEEKDFPFLLNKKIAEASEWDLRFLSNNDLKRLIIADYGEARTSLKSKNYKATVLLCGSIAEAILTDIVDQAKLPGVTTNALYQYGLSKLIDTARDYGLIKDQNLFSLLDPLRNYRNAIHPGVQIRKSISLNSSTAKIAVETITLLVKELKKP